MGRKTQRPAPRGPVAAFRKSLLPLRRLYRRCSNSTFPLALVLAISVIPYGNEVINVFWFPPAWKKAIALVALPVAILTFAYVREHFEKSQAGSHGATATPHGPLRRRAMRLLARPDPWLASGIAGIVTYIFLYHATVVHLAPEGTPPDKVHLAPKQVLVLPLILPQEMRDVIRINGGLGETIAKDPDYLRDAVEVTYPHYAAFTTCVFLALTLFIVMSLTAATTLAYDTAKRGKKVSLGEALEDAIPTPS